MHSINITALLSVYLAEQGKELFDSLADGATVEQDKLMELHLLADHVTRTQSVPLLASDAAGCHRPEGSLA